MMRQISAEIPDWRSQLLASREGFNQVSEQETPDAHQEMPGSVRAVLHREVTDVVESRYDSFECSQQDAHFRPHLEVLLRKELPQPVMHPGWNANHTAFYNILSPDQQAYFFPVGSTAKDFASLMQDAFNPDILLHTLGQAQCAHRLQMLAEKLGIASGRQAYNELADYVSYLRAKRLRDWHDGIFDRHAFEQMLDTESAQLVHAGNTYEVAHLRHADLEKFLVPSGEWAKSSRILSIGKVVELLFADLVQQYYFEAGAKKFRKQPGVFLGSQYCDRKGVDLYVMHPAAAHKVLAIDVTTSYQYFVKKLHNKKELNEKNIDYTYGNFRYFTNAQKRSSNGPLHDVQGNALTGRLNIRTFPVYLDRLFWKFFLEEIFEIVGMGAYFYIGSQKMNTEHINIAFMKAMASLRRADRQGSSLVRAYGSLPRYLDDLLLRPERLTLEYHTANATGERRDTSDEE